MTAPIFTNFILVITKLVKTLETQNASLHGKVRELEGEVDLLRLKIRALEIIQARPGKPEDERQQHLDVQATESVKVSEDESGESSDPEPAPKIPSSTTKRKKKKRISIEAKLRDLPVVQTTVLIPEEVQANPDLWEEISVPNITREVDNRRHENVETLIGGFEGILQSDGYAAYGNYADTHPEVILAACWAHAFRKFRDALEHEPAHAKRMMKLIGQLYELEEQWDEQSVSDATPDEHLLESLLPDNWAKANPGKLVKEPS